MRLLETYATTQGEGPNIGVPVTFVRFAGCNMRCPGWPCDTPYSIYPEQYMKEAKQKTPFEIVDIVRTFSPKHVCISGGEPLLQPKSDLINLFKALVNNHYSIDLFTNGSRSFMDYDIIMQRKVTIVMDWKLEGSGEGNSFKEQRIDNLNSLRPWDAVKFVVKNEADLQEAGELIKEYFSRYDEIHSPYVYIGTAWEQEVSPARIVDYILKSGLWFVRLNLQVHKYIWDPNQRGI